MLPTRGENRVPEDLQAILLLPCALYHLHEIRPAAHGEYRAFRWNEAALVNGADARHRRRPAFDPFVPRQ
jgi:hypothetical protein